MKALTQTDYHFPGQQSVYHGKVRDVYNIDGKKLVMVNFSGSAMGLKSPSTVHFHMKGLEEAALMDGASPMTILFRIYAPLCKAMLATLVLFSIVSHWNSWFEGLILMNRPDNYPLQSYLQTVVVNRDVTLMSNSDLQYFNVVSDRTSKAAQMFVATLPVIIVYPFLQKYFTTGATVGAVKE